MGRPLLRWLPAIVIAATALYTISVYPALPARMPTHWGVNGQPNGWSSREFGAWLLPGIMAFMWAFCAVLPKIDTRKANDEKFGVVYDVTVAAILTFQALIQFVILNVAQGHPVDLNTVVYVGLGAVFAVLSLAMSRRPSR